MVSTDGWMTDGHWQPLDSWLLEQANNTVMTAVKPALKCIIISSVRPFTTTMTWSWQRKVRAVTTTLTWSWQIKTSGHLPQHWPGLDKERSGHLPQHWPGLDKERSGKLPQHWPGLDKKGPAIYHNTDLILTKKGPAISSPMYQLTLHLDQLASAAATDHKHGCPPHLQSDKLKTHTSRSLQCVINNNATICKAPNLATVTTTASVPTQTEESICLCKFNWIKWKFFFKLE